MSNLTDTVYSSDSWYDDWSSDAEFSDTAYVYGDDIVAVPAPVEEPAPAPARPASLPSRYRTRKAERIALARALRARDRRRRLDELTYRYRHASSILASGFLASVVIVVAKSIGWI